MSGQRVHKTYNYHYTNINQYSQFILFCLVLLFLKPFLIKITFVIFFMFPQYSKI